MKTSKGNKLHIIILGKRNAGKSSLMNALLGQDYSIVSDVAGTTTDVNEKSMELLPIGPVVFLDTAGIDDVNMLGKKRIEKTHKALNRADVAIFVCDNKELKKEEKNLLAALKEKGMPTLVVVNKTDLGQIEENSLDKIRKYFQNILFVSLKNDKNITQKIKTALIKILPKEIVNPFDALKDIVSEGQTVILVIPVDKEAPKDRIILPQVQILRNLLDKNCICMVCKTSELKASLLKLKTPPALVITDSQAFAEVDKIVPENISLTSFSIIFARHKGDLKTFIKGADKLDDLKAGDRVLILESCTHHPIEDDIGRIKIPYLIEKYTKNNKLKFENYSGYDFPLDIKKYKLIIHCGACMTNRREILNRILTARENGVAITNYGITIAKCLGILPRATEIFNR